MSDHELRTCKVCGETKQASDFYSTGPNSRYLSCKSCLNRQRLPYRQAWKKRWRREAGPDWAPPETKTCRTCGQTKPADAFCKSNDNLTGLSPDCKHCTNTRNRARWNDPKRRDSRYRRHYGIGYDDYTALLDQQGGVCAICGKPETAIGKYGETWQLAVDHDHSTGAVRGLLCSKCNTAIGMLEDDTERFERAVNYLAHSDSTAAPNQVREGLVTYLVDRIGLA